MREPESGRVLRIVEARDAMPEQRAIREVDAGVYVADAKFLFEALERCGTDKDQGEIYLTEVVQLAAEGGAEVGKLQASGSDVIFDTYGMVGAPVHTALLAQEGIDVELWANIEAFENISGAPCGYPFALRRLLPPSCVVGADPQSRRVVWRQGEGVEVPACPRGDDGPLGGQRNNRLCSGSDDHASADAGDRSRPQPGERITTHGVQADSCAVPSSQHS